MAKREFMQNKIDEELHAEAESRINRDNVLYLLVLAVILFLSDFLNEIGVFAVAPIVMRVGTACGIVCYAIPAIVFFRQLNLLSRNPKNLVCHKWYKYMILASAWIGTAVACIMLTHHTVILMAVPIMLTAQYRNTKLLMPISIALGTVCVLLGVYGGYFFGCFDANMLNMRGTVENAADLALRQRIATPTRMVDLLLHYALPRELVVLALIILATNLSRRSNGMLHRQVELQVTVEQEMQRVNEMQRQVINGMANLIENRDSSTGEHVKRTSFYVKSIIDQLRINPAYAEALSEKSADTIVEAAPLHDIGKIVVADSILCKPGRLTPEEYEEIKLHASEGAKVIDNVLGNIENEEFIRAAKDIAGGHHERWDGKGYPNGIKGKEIPLSARIMAVADVFDALVSERVYKQPMPPEEAFELIMSESGKQFDPEIVEAFCNLKEQIISYCK